MIARLLATLCLVCLPASQVAAQASAPTASAPARRTITLAYALATARERQPSLRQARAATLAAKARVGQAAAPLYPQLSASANYQLTTANYVPRPGALPPGAAGSNTRPPPNLDAFSYWSFGASATQLVYDFGHTSRKKDAAEALVDAQRSGEREAFLEVAENVRVAYFETRAAKDLVGVAHETLANQERHLSQTEAFVRAGTRAEIDLAQVRTDRANARVTVINAENGYASAKARLNQAMGVEGATDFDVADESMPALPEEDSALPALVQRSLTARPEFAALQHQMRSEESTLGSASGGYWPSLGVSAAASEAGVDLANLTWNWNAGVGLTWRLFEGGLVSAQADEARASLSGLQAQFDALRQQVRVDVEQAQLTVRATNAVLGASDEAVQNARERMRLAEGRYQTGVGNGLELADAQLALSSAEAQRVQAEYNLASARSHLLRALGKD
jgi:outer membrane protein